MIPMTALDTVEQIQWLMMDRQSEQIVQLLKDMPKADQENENNVVRNMAVTILAQLAINKQRRDARGQTHFAVMN
jgi:hypothetical protein